HANWLEAAESRKLDTFDGSNGAKPDELDKDRRGKVVIRRIKPQAKIDWNTDPTALPYFFYQLRERTEGRFPMYLDNEGILLTGDDIFDYPIIYLTSHNSWLLADDEVENLKK